MGPYKLVTPIGAGGMGQVWKALDERLGRTVAVKVLAESQASDLRLRFEQEARAASALQHPNIVSVYDVGAEGGVPFIVSELVEGETLRALLGKGALPLRRTLEIGTQVASGMAAAHQAGITHRDLKPENIMIAADGRAKILDFGLARQSASSGAPRSDNSTDTFHSEPGLIMGTANYMSPEQARGVAVDARSDQFSFGIVLHEMLTGAQPFRRDSTPQTMSAIIAEEAPALPPAVPVPLQWVVARCLEKEPSQRYSSTADLYRDLRQMREHLTDLTRPAAAVAAPGRRVWWPAAAAAGFLLALALRLLISTGGEVAPVDLVPFATEPETETWPAFSPDGQSIAYSKAGSQIWVRGLNNPNAVLLAEGANGRPVWSRDSSRVCYKSGREFWCVSAAGGPPLKVLDDAGFSTPQYTPDGKGLLFIQRNPGAPPQLMLSAPAGAEAKPVDGVQLPDRASSLFPFSPDGKTLAVHTVTQDIWIQPYPKGVARLIPQTKGTAFDWYPDSRHAVISPEREAFQALYLIDTESAAQRLLLRGSTKLMANSMSPDGQRLVYSSGLDDSDIAEYGIDGKPVRSLVATTTRELYPAWSPAEERFAYVSYAGRHPSLWTRAADGSAPLLLREVPDTPLGPAAPAYSPDGRRIAFWAAPDLQTIPAAGGQPVTVAQTRAPVNDICWSADGVTLWYTLPGRLMKVSTLGGEPQMAGEMRGQQLACSPDGDWIAYANEQGLRLLAPGGKSGRVLIPGPLPPGRVQFGDGGRLLYQLVLESRELAVWDVAGGNKIRTIPLQLPQGDTVNRFSVHNDGRRILLQTGRVAYDLWIAEGFAQPAPVWRRWLQHWVIPVRPPRPALEPL